MLLLLFLLLQQLGLRLIRQNDVCCAFFLTQFPVCSPVFSVDTAFICTAPYTTRPSGGQRIVVMMIPAPIPMSLIISSFSVHLLSICIQILVWMGLLSCILHNLVLHLDFVFSSLYSSLSTLSNAGESLKYLLLLFYLFVLLFVVHFRIPRAHLVLLSLL